MDPLKIISLVGHLALLGTLESASVKRLRDGFNGYETCSLRPRCEVE